MIDVWSAVAPPASELLSLSMPALIKDTEMVGYPLLFASIAGSHLYGFDSSDSDYDIRSAHICPLYDFIGLREPKEVVAMMEGGDRVDVYGGGTVQFAQLDIVSFDLRKFFNLLLSGNGNVLEQITSPIVLTKMESVWPELQRLVNMSVSKRVLSHYAGFSTSIWESIQKKTTIPTIKEVLYVFRTLLTGLMLAENGQMITHLPTLLEHYPATNISDLIQVKREGSEKMISKLSLLGPTKQEYEAYLARLFRAKETTTLPVMNDERNTWVRACCSDFVARLRMDLEV